MKTRLDASRLVKLDPKANGAGGCVEEQQTKFLEVARGNMS